jgi:tetratricopeptide (TPR) repeat protein
LKNSAETSLKPSRFAISEHQLSLGLLALVLLAGAGYGIWLAIAPFLPKTAKQEAGVSRMRESLKLFEAGKWTKAIDIYHEMLVNDPDNGLALTLLSVAAERKWRQNWREIDRLGSTTGSNRATAGLMEAEEDYFKMAQSHFERLLDHARYQSRAYESLAAIHSFRFSKKGNESDADKAIVLLKEMLDKELYTKDGIDRNRDLMLLKGDRRFSSLVRREKRNSNFYQFEFEYPRSRGLTP